MLHSTHTGPKPARKFTKVDTGSPLTSGRVLANAKVITYCDFSEPGRKTEIGRHLTFATAFNQYARLWRIYHRIHGHRVWQEEVKSDDGEG